MTTEVEQWKRDLEAAGWTAASATAWYAPDGGLYRGPYGAWKELQRRNGTLIASDRDTAKAREIIGNVNNYAEEDGELSVSAFGPLSTRIAEALAAARNEERQATWRNAAEYVRTEWLAAYPVEVFPEPPPPPAACSRDVISAAMGRHIATRLIEYFEAQSKEGSET